MHIILGALALVAAAYFWIWRARSAAEMTHELLDVANDVRLAARRLGFRRRQDLHPADSIEDPKIAVAGIGAGFIELNDYPTAETRDALVRALREEFRLKHEDAEELVILGRWIMQQCNGPTAAIDRLSRKLHKMSGHDHFDALLKVLSRSAQPGGGLSEKQKAALEDIQRGFRLS